MLGINIWTAKHWSKGGKYYSAHKIRGNDSYGGAFSSLAVSLTSIHDVEFPLMIMRWMCVGFVHVFLTRRVGFEVWFTCRLFRINGFL